jgi:hypothetical protein
MANQDNLLVKIAAVRLMEHILAGHGEWIYKLTKHAAAAPAPQTQGAAPAQNAQQSTWTPSAKDMQNFASRLFYKGNQPARFAPQLGIQSAGRGFTNWYLNQRIKQQTPVNQPVNQSIGGFAGRPAPSAGTATGPIRDRIRAMFGY